MKPTTPIVAMAILLPFAADCLAADYSSPRAAAKAFATAVQTGDAAAAKDAALADDTQRALIDAMAAEANAERALHAAAVQRFGPTGRLVAENPAVDVDKAVDEEELVQKSADTATLGPKPNPKDHDQVHPIVLKQVQGQWKVDISSVGPPADIQQQTRTLTIATDAKLAIAQEIAAGKYPSAIEAAVALRDRIMAALKAPATSPAGT